MATIKKAVGIRNGTVTQPNDPADMELIRKRLDRIAFANGGTYEFPLWLDADDRRLRIIELTAAIVAFQSVHIASGRLRVSRADGVVDPGGRTLALLDELAGPDPIIAEVVKYDPMGVQTNPDGEYGSVISVEPNSVEAQGPLRVTMLNENTARMLVRVTGCDIQWFGVVFMAGSAFAPQACTPLIFFTPKPEQAGVPDGSYDTFIGTPWESLWERYTRKMGAQIAASGATIIFVLPLYPTARMNNFGNFRSMCAKVISSVITAACNTMDATALRQDFALEKFITGSFSNGIWAHSEFLSKCNMNDENRLFSIVFDSAHIWKWRPIRNVTYINDKPTGSKENLTHGAYGEYHLEGRYAPYVLQATPEIGHSGFDHGRAPMLMLHAMTRFGPR